MNSGYLVRSGQNGVVAHQGEQPGWKYESWLRRCVATIIILMLGYTGIGLWAVRGDLSSAARHFSLEAVVSVLVLIIIGIILRAIRWHYYVRRLGWSLPPSHSIVAFLASFALTATPGKAGEAIKIVLLRMRHDVPIAAGAGVLVIERLADVIAVLVLALAGVSLINGVGTYLALIVIFVASITAFVGQRRLQEPLLRRLGRIKRLSATTDRMARALDACRQLLQPAPFLVGVSLAIVAWSCEAVAFLRLANSAGIDIELLQASSIYAIATLAGVLSALPGGIGGFEAVMVLLLTQVGVGLTTATPTVVAFRLCTLWFGILLGLLFVLAWAAFIGGQPRSVATSRSA
jgi:uncharacterized protein (TIRG00374 family)